METFKNNPTKSTNGLSILLATKDRPDMVIRCVSSIIETSTHESIFEIIILDQSSNPQNEIRDHRVRYAHQPEIGKCRALNIGVSISKYEYMAVIDDDCVVESNWVLKMYTAIKNLDENNIVTGKVIAGEIEPNAEISVLHDDISRKEIYRKKFITPIFKLSGCNFGFTGNDIAKIGGFDVEFGPGSKFKSSDDNEWCYRALHNQRYILIYDPEIIVVHRSWRNFNKQTKQFSDYGYASGAFFCYILKHSIFDFLYHFCKLIYWSIRTYLTLNPKKILWQSLYLREFIHGFIRYAKK